MKRNKYLDKLGIDIENYGSNGPMSRKSTN
jgi:hypothetical protein